jgi:thioredoxin reductase (NADPH)
MVDNFPGFPEGIMGPELLERMKKQAERFGTEVITDVVSSVISSDSEKSQRDPCATAEALGGTRSQKPRDDRQRNTFIIKGQNEEYKARAVIIATGAQAKQLGIPTEEKFRGKGVSYCATCDGFFFRGKNIAVLGGGDTAMEEATFLTKFASHVTIIHRRNEFRASPIMVEKAKKDPKISFLLNTVVEEFYGDTILKGVRIRVDKGEMHEMPFDGVFVAIGHTPATEFLKNTVDLDTKGYVITFDRLATDHLRGTNGLSEEKVHQLQKIGLHYETCTSTLGIFAAGDCVDSKYRQGIVAAGMGAMAAIDVEKYLEM